MAGSMRGGMPLFSFKGIGVFVHWSFLLLPAYVAYVGWQEGMVAGEILKEIGLVLIVFACVLLHEFGHSLTALRYGINTKNIVLLPIGGVASLEHMPEEPKKEFWITLAGPLVNLVLAALAIIAMFFLGLTDQVATILKGETNWSYALVFMFAMNSFMFLFNLIPAYPMDGGRLLRSMLSMKLGRPKATKIAGRIGQVLSVGFVAAAIYMQTPFLGLIGVFIFMAAANEVRTLQPRKPQMDPSLIGAHLTTNFTALEGSATIAQATSALEKSNDQLVVVLTTNEVEGILTHDQLQAASPEATLSTLPVQRMPSCSPTDLSENVGRYMLTQSYPVSFVIEKGRLLGLVTAASLRAGPIIAVA